MVNPPPPENTFNVYASLFITIQWQNVSKFWTPWEEFQSAMLFRLTTADYDWTRLVVSLYQVHFNWQYRSIGNEIIPGEVQSISFQLIV